MIYRYELLNEVQVNHCNDFFDFSNFEDGKKTGSDDKEVKNNQEMAPDETNAAYKILWGAFSQHEIPHRYLLAYRTSGGLFSRYTKGNHYNWHTDSAYMNESVRSDFSTTVFLNNPDEYEGGNLVLKMGNEILKYKLQKGWAISYPTGTPHMVEEITEGERKVAIFWTESKFRDQEARNIMIDNYEAMRGLLEKNPDAEKPSNEFYPIYRSLCDQEQRLNRYRALV